MIILIRGLPGSGKTTEAKKMQKAIGAKHFEADMFHTIDGVYRFNVNNIADAHNWCQAQTAYWLNRGSNVIVSNTSTTIREMEPYFKMAKKYGVDVEVIEMKGDYGTIHDVPEDVIQRMKDRWEDYVVN